MEKYRVGLLRILLGILAWQDIVFISIEIFPLKDYTGINMIFVEKEGRP
jgi:prephenate dehydratase